MFQKLVNHNDDIRRLVEKGYAVAFDSNYLVVRDIPYLGKEGDLRNGAFVTKLVFIDQNRVAQEDHQVFFAGEHPCQLDGTPIANLGGGPTPLALGEKCADVVVERSFSNKPKVEGKFSDFFAKIESYTGIISGPAIERYGVTPYTFRVDSNIHDNNVFKFQDTLTSRAEITDLAGKFENEVVAVFGLGGTGAYLLDFLVKTPVREIRAFDLDGYHVHNAFRSPGKLDPGELGKSKAEVYQSRYENFRNGLRIMPEYVDATSSEAIDGVTFAFVCVDKGSSRAGIFELLIDKGIPFIDVGMGLSRKQCTLTGMVRTTYYPSDSGAEMRDRQLAELNDGPEGLYRTNIQIAELNALNASLAIIRYKQLRGFYFEEISNLHLLFGIDDLKIAGESNFNED
ncbi:ThiF family adenylyltransferase [Methylomicrobium lacus]|uniref:ThiF family adenylyltransferase n=1 Tax=Methylomicrobium lacus TaxID=136992 RepID=UPI0035A8C1B3